jgi:MFS family permease
MIAALRAMDPAALHTPPRLARRGRGQMRSALSHVACTPGLLIPLAMMAVVGTLSFNFQVLLPLLASFTWHGTAATYTSLAVAMGIGSVAGALAAGARGRADPRLLVAAAAAFGVAELLVAAAPTIPLQLAALIPLGAVSVTFAAGVNSAMQLAVDPAMRGRVMALYSVVFLGSTPIGAPLVGWIAEVAGPRAGLLLGAAAALAAAVGGGIAFARAGEPVVAVAQRECEGERRARIGVRARLAELRH